MLTPEQIAKPNTEHAQQSAFFAWCAIAKIPELTWIHAVPNGGERNAIVASRMKAEGAKSGIWDVFLPLPCGRYAGLYIEFKKPGREREKDGGLSDEQKLFGEWARTHHYCTLLVYTWQQGRDAVVGYLAHGET